MAWFTNRPASSDRRSPRLIRLTALSWRYGLNVRSSRPKSSKTASIASLRALSSTTWTVTGIPITFTTRRTSNDPSGAGRRIRSSIRLFRGTHARRWAGVRFQPAQRQQDPDHETRLVVHQLDRAAVCADDPPCDGQTKSAAHARAAAVHPKKRFEYLAAVLGRDARPPIRDLQA